MISKRGVGVGILAAGFVVGCICVWACGGDDSSGAGGGGASSGGASNGGTSNGASGTGTESGASGGGTTSGATSSTGGPPGVGVPGPGTTYAGCQIFPNDNAWNTDITALPVDTDLMGSIFPHMSTATGLHPDWGTFAQEYGIPITTGSPGTPQKLTFNTNYGPKESDPLACPGGAGICYPIPLTAKIEGGTTSKSGSDRHVLFLDTTGAPGHCMLYELYNAQNPGGSGWTCASGALFHLDSDALRTEGWTSADAAGLSVLAGLVKKEEIDRGAITHAIRFTMGSSQNGYIHPATHAAGDTSTTLPPMGLRLRLKPDFNESGFSGAPLVIVKAMKKFGIILADNGSDWYLSGETSDAWDMDPLVTQLGKIKGSDFEIVKTGSIIPQPN